MMDICVLNPYFYPYKGGTEKVLLEVYRRLAKKHNITVVTSTVPGRNEYRTEGIEGIRVIRHKTKQYWIPGLPLPFESFEGLNSEIRGLKADIYHINNRYQYFYLNVKSIKSSGKLCLTIHNSLPRNIDLPTDFFGYLYDAAWGRPMMHQADVITGVSAEALKATVPKRDLGKTHVVYNGVDYRNFVRHPRTHPKVARILDELGFTGPIILCNGRFVQQKGQQYLMHALKMLPDSARAPNLLLIGKGPMEAELRRTAKDLGINLQVRSDLGDDELPYYYSASDVSVAPSLYEPASLVVLESMSCEIPVVASRVGGIPEMLGRCGYYSKPRDAKSIARAISKALSSTQEVKIMGSSARKRVIREHSWDKIAKRYETLFLNTLES